MTDAVDCAVAIQRGSAERNARLPQDYRLGFRVGINLGEAIIEDDDIYGDGVNVAARLQEFADPGGICISGTVFEQVDGKVDHVFADLGDQKLKNIPKPVRGPFGAHQAAAVLRHVEGQGFAGAPVIAGSMYATEALRFTASEPKYYKTSPLAERGFWANCGSSLIYRPLIEAWSDWVVIFTASLDDPAPNAPTWHLGVESRMPWLDLHDDLPRTRCADAPDLIKAWGARRRRNRRPGADRSTA